MLEVKQVLDRIKNLSYYEVVIPLPPLFRFTGKIPFTIKVIEEDYASCTVLAESFVEAEHKVLEYFRTQV